MPAHPANVHRLLYDEDQLVLVFPEGRKGTEKLYKDRYRCGASAAAASSRRPCARGAPIVPVARRRRRGGDADLRPRSTALQRLTGLLYFPLTPTFPHFGLLGMFGYLPAKFRIRFLEPIPTDQWGDEPWDDRGARPDRRRGHPRAASRRSSTTCSAKRRSVWFG